MRIYSQFKSDIILMEFFQNKLKVIEIAKKLGVSKQYISKVVNSAIKKDNNLLLIKNEIEKENSVKVKASKMEKYEQLRIKKSPHPRSKGAYPEVDDLTGIPSSVIIERRNKPNIKYLSRYLFDFKEDYEGEEGDGETSSPTNPNWQSWEHEV